MKQVLSLFTFGIGALFFLAFFTTLKPTAVTAASVNGTDCHSPAWIGWRISMVRAWYTPIFAIATVYFIIDGAFSYVTRPITAWLSKRKLLERGRRWVTSLGPYPSFALLAVPVIILEPAKPLSGYLIGTGHFFLGAVVFIMAEVLKLTVVERLFQLNKKKLLSIPLFAWGYGHWRRMMDLLESTKAWRMSRRMANEGAGWVRAVRTKLRFHAFGRHAT